MLIKKLRSHNNPAQTYIVVYNKFDKEFGGLGLSECGQTEDSCGLLSGMIERCVAYLVAVHPQIV